MFNISYTKIVWSKFLRITFPSELHEMLDSYWEIFAHSLPIVVEYLHFSNPFHYQVYVLKMVGILQMFNP